MGGCGSCGGCGGFSAKGVTYVCKSCGKEVKAPFDMGCQAPVCCGEKMEKKAE